MRIGHDGKATDYKCRKTNNLRESPDNTKHFQVPLPNHHSKEVIDILKYWISRNKRKSQIWM